jgi:hypothetical protein
MCTECFLRPMTELPQSFVLILRRHIAIILILLSRDRVPVSDRQW